MPSLHLHYKDQDLGLELTADHVPLWTFAFLNMDKHSNQTIPLINNKGYLNFYEKLNVCKQFLYI